MRIPLVNKLFGKKPPLEEQGKVQQIKAGLLRYSLIKDAVTDRKGVGIYSDMRRDPDVKTGLAIKADGILSKGWEIHPGEEKNTAADEQAEFVIDCLNTMQGSFDDVLSEIVKDGLSFGIGIAERNWLLRDDGKIGYRDIKPKDPALFTFDCDEFMNVAALRLVMAFGGNDVLDLSKFARFVYNAEHGNPWGTSDLQGAYRYWWAKQKLMDWWCIYLEKYGMPTVRGGYPRGTPKTLQDQLLTVLNGIQNETAIVLPDDITTELMEAQKGGQGQSGYESALRYCGDQIIKSIIGNTLTTGEGKRVGSLALGQVHQDTQEVYVRKLRRKVEEFVDEEIIRPLLDYNFAEPIYPNFTLSLDEKDTGSLAEILFRLVSIDEVKPGEPWVREWLGLPEYEAPPPERMPEEPPELEESPGDEEEVEETGKL